MGIYRFILWRHIGLMLTLLATVSHAEEPVKVEVQYINLKPPFVTNYGGGGSRLKYLKVDVAVKVSSSDAAEKVQHHMPLIRNQLVMLFSSQSAESLGNSAGREQLRQQALQDVQALLKVEEGSSTVEDVLFNGFITQN